MRTWNTISINQHVKLTLTQAGKVFVSEKSLLAPDSNNQIQLPLWEAMQLFGPRMFQGSTERLFEEDILIAETKPKVELLYTHGPSGYCPVQAEGTINGYPFYFRSRGGTWLIKVASAPHLCPIEDSNGWVYRENYPSTDKFAAGYATVEECKDFITKYAELFVKTRL